MKEDHVLPEKELDEIRARCASASRGPWRASLEGRDHVAGSDIIITGESGERGMDIELSGAKPEDYDFIAHARQDIPRLLEEVDRLRRLLKAAEPPIGPPDSLYDLNSIGNDEFRTEGLEPLLGAEVLVTLRDPSLRPSVRQLIDFLVLSAERVRQVVETHPYRGAFGFGAWEMRYDASDGSSMRIFEYVPEQDDFSATLGRSLRCWVDRFLIGPDYTGDISTLKTVHVGHILTQAKHLGRLLSLPRGFRFETAPGSESVWFGTAVAADDST